MKAVDFYEAMHDFEPSKHLGTILKLICDKHAISRQDFIVLLEIHARKEFTWDDFATAEITASWDKLRFYRWKDTGLIELYRAKDGKFRRYNIYRCTRKAKNIVREYYDYSSGKVTLPTLAFSKNARYSSNRLTRKINILKDE